MTLVIFAIIVADEAGPTNARGLVDCLPPYGSRAEYETYTAERFGVLDGSGLPSGLI